LGGQVAGPLRGARPEPGLGSHLHFLCPNAARAVMLSDDENINGPLSISSDGAHA
jgi:hypothetical protein